MHVQDLCTVKTLPWNDSNKKPGDIMSESPVTISRPPHSGRWPRTARLVWRERVETNEEGERLLVWEEVWTRPSRKFGRSKEGRLRQVGKIAELAAHFPRLLKANGQNGVLTLARPAYTRRAEMAELDARVLARLKAELKRVFSVLYDHAIAYLFTPDAFEVVRLGPAADWSIYIDGWNHATRHKVREPDAKKTAYFADMEAEQLLKIDEYFAPYETRAKTRISALLNHD